MKVEVHNMILQFRVKNFKSIGKEVVLDMTATGAREHKEDIVCKNGVDILPVAVIYGANASGKTNVLAALAQFRRTITTSHLSNPNEEGIYSAPFLFDKIGKESPTEFEVYLSSNNGEKEYHYGFSTFQGRIIEEYLEESKLSRNETVWKEIFCRDSDGIRYSKVKKYSQLKDFEHLISETMLFLSFLGPKKIKEADIFSEIYYWAVPSTDEFAITSNDFMNFNSLPIALRTYSDEKIKDLILPKVLEFLKQFDPCIEDIKIEENVNSEGKKVLSAYTIHKGVSFDLNNESDGTKKLFINFLWILMMLSQGGLILADELDAKLHPLIIRKIVNLFRDPESNKGNAQLIFSSHNLILLDPSELRRDEIWFAEKDMDGYTSLFSLAEFKTNEKNVRSDLDYGKHYLAGKFGAIPFLNQGE